ncbi:hypothetical protein HZH68_014533 [Vespula germanica]|uniref:Uncharacterized protein n=1 Tax=Vespula germanica TaxID=30212 RepID=A0A834JDT4_VESGE|nr:hypothetical protein HZH68_014533 [Vespula germanica]
MIINIGQNLFIQIASFKTAAFYFYHQYPFVLRLWKDGDSSTEEEEYLAAGKSRRITWGCREDEEVGDDDDDDDDDNDNDDDDDDDYVDNDDDEERGMRLRELFSISLLGIGGVPSEGDGRGGRGRERGGGGGGGRWFPWLPETAAAANDDARGVTDSWLSYRVYTYT